jgi:hypothetical protein
VFRAGMERLSIVAAGRPRTAFFALSVILVLVVGASRTATFGEGTGVGEDDDGRAVVGRG